MTKVVKRDGETIDSMLRRFRKQVGNGRILSEVRKRRFYTSDSEKRRIALRKAMSKERQRQRRQRRGYSRR